MNFIDTLKSVDLILSTGEVPLIVGESGIGKTALANKLAKENDWSLIVIDGNLLKEGEIGGLPTIESYVGVNSNGYKLHDDVKILAAMNPSSKYGSDFDYQVVDMDAAQENRFVWLNMESDHTQWIKWAIDEGIERKVIEFISTFPEYLHKINEDDVRATPRSYERVSKIYKVYKEKNNSIPRAVFLNVVKGNVGKVIAEEFISFIESNSEPLISYEDVFLGESIDESIVERVKNESHTRLYLSAMNILKDLELNIKNDKYESNHYINRFIEFLKMYPVDLMIGIMKDIRNSYIEVYKKAIENEEFVKSYFESYSLIRG